jgi:hypothetical protein
VAGSTVNFYFFFFYICAVHLDIIKVIFLTTHAQVIVFKRQTILKFTLKQLRHVSVQSHHLQAAHYPHLLKLHFVTIANYGTSACVDEAAYIGRSVMN